MNFQQVIEIKKDKKRKKQEKKEEKIKNQSQMLVSSRK